ncbi:MAG TPA: extracellular solute-binding protein [Limnochordia bacterium]
MYCERSFFRPFAVFLLLAVAALSPLSPQASAAEPLTLEFVVNAWHQAVIDSIQSAVSRFERLHPGLRVYVHARSGSWNDVVVRVAAGVPPDVVTTGVFTAGEWYENGVIIPLDPFVSDALREQIFEPMWHNFTWQGHVLAVPAIESGPRQGMVWNRDMLDAAGLALDPDRPMTWRQFFDYSDKLTVVDAEGRVSRIGFDPRNGQNSRLFTMAPLWNASIFATATGRPQLNHPNFVGMIDLITDRVFRRHPDFKGSTAWYAIAETKSVAVTALGSYGPGEIRTRDPEMRIVVGWGPHDQGTRVQQTLGWGLAIPNGAPHPEESFALINFLATDLAFNTELFERTGFFGGSKALFSQLAREVSDESVRWYIQSVLQADLIDAPSPDRFIGRANALFADAVNRVYRLEDAAETALAEANRLLVAEMREEGRL